MAWKREREERGWRKRVHLLLKAQVIRIPKAMESRNSAVLVEIGHKNGRHSQGRRGIEQARGTATLRR